MLVQTRRVAGERDDWYHVICLLLVCGGLRCEITFLMGFARPWWKVCLRGDRGGRNTLV